MRLHPSGSKFQSKPESNILLHKKTQNWKSKKLWFNSCCITCFHIMAVNVSAIISHSSNKSFYIKKKKKKQYQKLIRVQVMPKRNTFWNIHTRRKIDQIFRSYCNPPATSWFMSEEPRCLFGRPESSLSPSVSFWSPWLDWQTCCSYSWDSKHKHRQNTASSYRRASRCFN